MLESQKNKKIITMTHRPKILAIGECMIELSAIAHNQYQSAFAGDTLNTLYYLAQHSDCSYMTVIGQDQRSEAFKSFLIQNKIKTDYVVSHPEKQMGLYLIDNDASGERYFSYYRNDSAAKTLMTFWSNITIEQLCQFDVIYLSGITLAILGENDAIQLINHLERYQHQGGQIFFDNNYRSKLWCNPKQAHKLFQTIHQLASVIFVTYADEQDCYQDSNIEACYRRYQAYAALTVIKDGPNPVSVIHNNSIQQYPSLKVKKVIDTTGAGDAFNAGFIAGYLSGHNIEKACQQACLLASKVIQHQGALIKLPHLP